MAWNPNPAFNPMPYGGYQQFNPQWNMPQTYQPHPVQPQQAQNPAAMQPPQPQNRNGFNTSVAFVNSEQEAKEFMVMPGNTIWLISQNEPVFWIKTTDSSGMPQPLRTFDYMERVTNTPHVNAVQSNENLQLDYVTRAEFDALAARLDALSAPKETRTRKSTVTVKEKTDENEQPSV